MTHPLDARLGVANTDVTACMRSKLIVWMWDVCRLLSLHACTLFRAVYLLDSRIKNDPDSVEEKNLQLTGTAALFVAGKLEEVDACCVREFADISEGRYSVADILESEQSLVTILDWKLQPPVIAARTLFEEHAIVLMAIDGGIVLSPLTPALKATVEQISLRLRKKKIRVESVCDGKTPVEHFNFVVSLGESSELKHVNAFYCDKKRLSGV